MARQSAFNWMRKVLQGEFTPTLLCSDMGHLPGLDKLLTTFYEVRDLVACSCGFSGLSFRSESFRV